MTPLKVKQWQILYDYSFKTCRCFLVSHPRSVTFLPLCFKCSSLLLLPVGLSLSFWLLVWSWAGLTEAPSHSLGSFHTYAVIQTSAGFYQEELYVWTRLSAFFWPWFYSAGPQVQTPGEASCLNAACEPSEQHAEQQVGILMTVSKLKEYK